MYMYSNFCNMILRSLRPRYTYVRIYTYRFDYIPATSTDRESNALPRVRVLAVLVYMCRFFPMPNFFGKRKTNQFSSAQQNSTSEP